MNNLKHITRSLRRIIRKLKSIHWVYLLLHLLLLVVGILLITIGSPIVTTIRGVIIVSVGGSVIAAAFAGWVLFIHVWLSQEEFNRLEIIRKFGLVEVFEKRSVGIKREYDTRLERARDAIEIMGFGLRALREDYRNDFANWAARAQVRILLLDPEFPNAESPIADQRDKEENDNQGAINRDVHAFIKNCADLCMNKQLHFEIRLYRCLPSINIFRIDDNLFWGPYLIGDVSRNFPTFLLDQQGILYKRLLDHFNKIWSQNDFSRPVPAEWFEPDSPTRDS